MILLEYLNTKGKEILLAQILSVFFVTFAFCKENEVEKKLTQLSNEETEVVNVLADFQFIKWKNDSNITKSRLPELYKVLSMKRPLIIESCLDLYRIQILRDMDRQEEAIKLAREQVNKSLDKPNLLSFLASSKKDDAIERNKMWHELGRILPLSMWGYESDRRLSPPSPSLLGLTPPRIPIILPGHNNIQGVLATIGDFYESIGFTDDALNLYIVSFYALPTSEDHSFCGKLWLKIAEIERNRGNKHLSIKGYFNAAYNWYEYAEQAKKGIDEVLSESEPNKEISNTKPRLEKDVAIKIADLYKKLNLHPLALAVLEKSEGDTGENLSGEKEEILKEWNKILEKLRGYYRLSGSTSSGEVDFYVLGQKVSEVKDWAKIKLLRPTDSFWRQ